MGPRLGGVPFFVPRVPGGRPILARLSTRAPWGTCSHGIRLAWRTGFPSVPSTNLMNRFLARVVLAVSTLAAVWLVGCATQPEDASLDMRLVNLRFAQATVLETTVVADIRFENVAPADVEITGAAHKLVVNGRRLGRGLASQSITVPRLGSSIQSVEVRLGHLSVAKTLDEVSRSHLVDYEINSTLYFRSSGGRERTMKLQRQGILDLSRMAVSPRR